MIDNDDVSAVAEGLTKALETAQIPCAIGGALALGVWGAPRGTTDVDLDVFVKPDDYERMLDVFAGAGCRFDRATAMEQARDGSTIVVRHGDWRVDVFVPTIPFYDLAEKRIKRVPFRGGLAPFLDAESIAVFKLLFFRGKDIVDLERLVAAGDVDHRWVRAQIEEMLGEDDERIPAWDRIVADHSRTA